MQEKISLSEGSTVDLRKPGEEMDNFSELAEESMEPEECFPECGCFNITGLCSVNLHPSELLHNLCDPSYFVFPAQFAPDTVSAVTLT